MKVAAAKDRVAKLEIAIAVMEGVEGPESRVSACGSQASVGSSPGGSRQRSGESANPSR